MGILDQAIARQAAHDTRQKPVDWNQMNKIRPAQKAALTRAIKTGDPEKIAAVCKAAVAAWNEIGAWPDDWSRWQRALDDALGWPNSVDIKYL
jgi:hypothetical protein